MVKLSDCMTIDQVIARYARISAMHRMYRRRRGRRSA